MQHKLGGHSFQLQHSKCGYQIERMTLFQCWKHKKDLTLVMWKATVRGRGWNPRDDKVRKIQTITVVTVTQLWVLEESGKTSSRMTTKLYQREWTGVHQMNKVEKWHSRKSDTSGIDQERKSQWRRQRRAREVWRGFYQKTWYNWNQRKMFPQILYY